MPNYYRTKILTSIKSLEEISLVLKKGVDIIDFKNPSEGALGALSINKINLSINIVAKIPKNQEGKILYSKIKNIETKCHA